MAIAGFHDVRHQRLDLDNVAAFGFVERFAWNGNILLFVAGYESGAPAANTVARAAGPFSTTSFRIDHFHRSQAEGSYRRFDDGSIADNDGGEPLRWQPPRHR